MYKISMHF